MDKKVRQPKEPRSLPWGEVIQEFCQSTTLHGVNRVVEPSPFLCRKLFWLCLVVIGLGLLTFQVVDRVMYYVSYPVTVNVKINHNETLRFPAVTLCNQNAFRITEAADRKYYYWLDDLYSQADVRTFNYRKYGVGEISRFELFSKTAHKQMNLIYECKWDGQPCDVDDFTTVLTDHGVCYTFNSGKVRPAFAISQTGSDAGLKLTLNVEQYEYMRGPHNSAGLKILLHNQNEIPFVRDLGEAIPIGSNAFVGVAVLQVKNMPYPHGDCVDSKDLHYYEHYTLSACKRDCQTRYVVNRCGCGDFYMPLNESSVEPNVSEGSSDRIPYCTVAQHIDCLDLATAEYKKLLSEDKSFCSCPTPCATTHYSGTTSYATTTNLNTHQLLHDNRSSDLSKKFLAALEAEQRLNQDIIKHDRLLITLMKTSCDNVTAMMEGLKRKAACLREESAALMKDVAPRLSFHLLTGVNKTRYIADHDFARGWEVMDERTIMHTTTGYIQMMEAFTDMINVSFSSNDKTLRQFYYLDTKRDLQARLSLASRAFDNMTEIHEGFYNGTPILTYEASPDRRYDMSYISVELLRFNPRESEYAELLLDSFLKYKEYLKTLMNVNIEVYENRTIDIKHLRNILKRIDYHSRQINFNRFRYGERIVFGLKEQAKIIVEDFLALNSTLQSSITEMERALNFLIDAVEYFDGSTWERILRAVGFSGEYLYNHKVSKLSVGQMLGSDKMLEDMRAARTFFADIRLRSQQAEDSWAAFGRAYHAVWQSMLDNIHLEDYYQMIHDDVITAIRTTNHTEKSYLLSVLSEHGLIPLESVMNLTLTEMNRLFNSDFAVLNKTAKYAETEALFETVLSSNSLVKALGDDGDVFIERMEELQASMKQYTDSTVITSDFYMKNFLDLHVYMKDLSYEEVQQQVAFDVIALLSDIGGSMGLFVGASIITVFEVLDMVVHQLCERHCVRHT